MREEALSGYRILDLSNGVAGLYCSRLLTCFGAEVIGVERPGDGCDVRRRGPFVGGEPHPERGCLFLYLNVGKKSITLNLNVPSGIKLFQELVGKADVVVEDSSPGVMESLGLGYDVMQEINPSVICCSISPFGQFGPYRDYKGTEIIYQAVSGIMYQTGPYDRPPVVAGLEQGQYLAGVNAALAITTSLFSRGLSGRGEHLDISILESILPWSGYAAIWYVYAGAVFRRLPKVPSLIEAVIPTKDGYISPSFLGYTDWDSLCAMLDSTELADPKFASWEERIEHAEELQEVLQREFAKWETKELVERAQEWRFAFGALQTAEDLCSCPQLIARDFLVENEHQVCGKLTYPGIPFRMSETPGRIRHPAPLLGEHNSEVYCGLLGYSADVLVRLREAEVI